MGVGHTLEQTAVDKGAQPYRQRWPGDVEVAREMAEASYAEEGLAHDQHRPALTDNFERARDGFAVEAMRQIIGSHGSSNVPVHKLNHRW